MHLLRLIIRWGTFASPAFAFTKNNGGNPSCVDSHTRVGTIHDTIKNNMSDTALISAQFTNIACSEIERVAGVNKGMCAWLGNTGGNIFSKTKILALLAEIGYNNSCGSVPINYPSLPNSYSALTVNWVSNTHEYRDLLFNDSQISQGSGPQNDYGYAGGWCRFHLLQYQASNGAGNNYGSLSSLIDPSQPETTYMDLQILDANHYLLNDTWYHQSDPSLPWNLPSKLPGMFLVTAGPKQMDAVSFTYNGDAWTSSTTNPALFQWSSNNNQYENGFRSGSGGFTC